MSVKVVWNEIEIQHLPADQRVSCFDEVNLGYSAQEAMLEAQRCLQCPKPACQEGCPNDNPIRDFVDLIAEGKFEKAAELGWTQNALPSCTGRVCAWESQCEGFCVLVKRGDPINIGALERFMSDFALGIPVKTEVANGAPAESHPLSPLCTDNHRQTIHQSSKNGRDPQNHRKTDQRVAVVGAGPAGLAVAHFLGKKGYPVTVFDRHNVSGGVMAYGIPEFVLPQHVIDKEVERIQGLGVQFRFGVTIGRDVAIDDLFEHGYEAIFIGIGANKPATLDIPGHDLKGVYTAKDFLMDTSFGHPPTTGPRVAVIGAGNTAMDAARTALRLGAEEVTVLYRRSEAESPSRPIEIGFAKEEGVRFHYLVNPTRLIGDKEGNLTGIELVKMKLDEADDSGRPRPVPIPGSEYIMPVDTCITAIGYKHENLIPKQVDLSVDSWGGLVIDNETGATNQPGIFAGGDCVTGSKTVVHAIAAGRRAAAAIERYLD